MKNRLFYTGLTGFVPGCLAVYLVLLRSRSVSPVVLGRYSPVLFLVTATAGIMLLLLIVTALFRIDRLKRVIGVIMTLLGRAGISLELTIILFPPVFFLFFIFSDMPIMMEPLFIVGIVVSYIGLVLLCLAVLDPARSRKMFQRIVLSFGSITLSLVALEVAMRIVTPTSVFHPTLNLKPHLCMRIRVDLPGVSHGGLVTTNRWGFRGEEPPEDWENWFTIVAIGGSTTINFYLDDQRTWPHLLQEYLREVYPGVWVGNGGIPAHSTRGHIVFMREVIPEIKPDAVIFLTGVNDLGHFLRVWDKKTEPGYINLDIRYSIFCASRIVQLLYNFKINYIDDVEDFSPESARPYLPEKLLYPESELIGDLHDVMMDPDEYKNNIRTLIEMAREQGVTPVFLTHPLLFEDTEYWRGIVGGTRWFETTDNSISAATLWNMLNTLNNDLMDICHKEGVLCFDLASVIDHSSNNFYDVMHFTENGAAAVALETAAFLLEQDFLPNR